MIGILLAIQVLTDFFEAKIAYRKVLSDLITLIFSNIVITYWNHFCLVVDIIFTC